MRCYTNSYSIPRPNIFDTNYTKINSHYVFENIKNLFCRCGFDHNRVDFQHVSNQLLTPTCWLRIRVCVSLVKMGSVVQTLELAKNIKTYKARRHKDIHSTVGIYVFCIPMCHSCFIYSWRTLFLSTDQTIPVLLRYLRWPTFQTNAWRSYQVLYLLVAYAR